MRLTSPAVIRTLCEKYNFSLSKSFGQHFLTNPSVCPRICEAAGIDENSEVLEIGPGFGTLTQELALRAKKVVALEVDRRLLPVLDETLAEFPHAHVLLEDAMKADLPALMAQYFSGPVTVCANLPYNLTSPILMRLLESRLFSGITVMIQKEAAERISAAPGTRAAGAITYATHYYAEPRMEFSVSAGSFYPPPKVKSAVISLRPQPGALQHNPQREEAFFRLVRSAFAQRRKTLLNALYAGLNLPKETLTAAFDAAGLLPTLRPEQLTLDDYLRLENALALSENKA